METIADVGKISETVQGNLTVVVNVFGEHGIHFA